MDLGLTGTRALVLESTVGAGHLTRGAILLSVNGVLVQRGHDAPIRFVAVPLDVADAILQADKAVVLDLCTKISVVSSTDLFSSERLLQLNLVDGRQG